MNQKTHDTTRKMLMENFNLRDCRDWEIGGRVGHLKLELQTFFDWCIPDSIKKNPTVKKVVNEQGTNLVGCYHNYLGGGLKGCIVPVRPTKRQLFGDRKETAAIKYVMDALDAFDEIIVELFYILEDEPEEYPDGTINWEHLDLPVRQSMPVSVYQ